MPKNAIIGGGGIGGATLAHLLARAGWNIVILEKSATPIRMDRPEVLWPPTLRILADILPPDAYIRAILPVAGMGVYQSGKPLLSFDVPRQSTHPAAGAAFTDPNLTRRLLLESSAFEVRRGFEIAGLLHDAGRLVGVRAKEVATGAQSDLPATWVIGDDGGHSSVRAACGIRCDVTMLPAELLCFGFDWPADFPQAVGHLFINQRCRDSGIFLMGAAPFPDGRGAGLMPVRPELMQDPSRAASELDRFLEINPQAAPLLAGKRFPDDVVRVRTGYGHAERYGVPGAFLIGDAAHPVTPAGGQGANLSVNDAATLAPILLANHPNPLAVFERLRRPAAERSLRLSRAASRAMKLPDALIRRLIPLALRIVGMQPRLFSPVLRTTSTAFTTRRQE